MSANTQSSTDQSKDRPADIGSAGFRVVVYGVPDELELLERALMSLPDMDRATAKLQTHLLPGILPHAYEQPVAITVAEAITRLGVTAMAVSASEVPDVSHVHPTHHVRMTEETLEAFDTSDNVYSCPWSAVSVISVGVLPSSAPSRFRSASTLSNGSSHRSWNSGIRVAAKHRPEAYIVLSDGQPALSLASDEMNYEYLGDRLVSTSSTNFRVLIQDLVHRATAAWITPSTLAFLEHTPLPRSEFRSHEEFRRYTEFQTQLSRRQSQESEPK